MKRQLTGIGVLLLAGGTCEHAIDMQNLKSGITGFILGIIGVLLALGSGE